MKIEVIEGFSEKIGLLISHKLLTRKITLSLVKNLSKDELDFNFDDLSNSIGTILFHIAALEFYYQRLIFFNRNLSSDEYAKYEHGLPGNMNTRRVIDNDIKFYLDELNIVKEITLKELKLRDDNWLFDESNWGEDFHTNNYSLLQHLIDDEINHQGQIKWVKQRLYKQQ